MTNLFFYQCKSVSNFCTFCAFSWLSFSAVSANSAVNHFWLRLCCSKTFVVRKKLNQQNKKMQNEPNSNLICGKTTNEQRTMNNELLSNEPNLKNTKISATSLPKRKCANFYPFDRQKNEPNLCKTNPITNSLIYPFTHLLINAIMLNEPNLPGCQITHLINEQPTMNHEQFSNEPNFKNTKISVTQLSKMAYSNFHRFKRRKNEPNSTSPERVEGFCKTNPIYSGEDILRFILRITRFPERPGPRLRNSRIYMAIAASGIIDINFFPLVDNIFPVFIDTSNVSNVSSFCQLTHIFCWSTGVLVLLMR